MTAYYNENDPFAASWLRNLIKAGHIAPGFVDERSIIDVQPEEIHQYTQCHFFAGIGGWSYALRLAGWPDDRAVWTGSPPCQPFSTAGLQRGKDDARHLAPHWLELVQACRPVAVFGEQVAAAIRHGWIDDLQNALEREDYATGAIVLPACSIGAPHLRQRLWFTAHRLGDTDNAGLERHSGDGDNVGGSGREEAQQAGSTAQASGTSGLACWTRCDACDDFICNIHGMHAYDCECPGIEEWCERGLFPYDTTVSDFRLANSEHNGRDRQEGHAPEQSSDRQDGWVLDGGSTAGGLADTDNTKRRANDTGGNYANGKDPGREKSASNPEQPGADSGPDPDNSFWADADWLGCRDGKWRPVEPGTFPLVNGATARVGRLRGYGNAIVPQVAAQIIKAMM